MQIELLRKLQDSETHGRLLNWGRWLRYDPMSSRLGLPWKSSFIFSPSRGSMIADIDAAHIEWVVSTIDMAGRRGFGSGELHAFVLRVEYAERPEGLVPPVSQRAKDVSRRFKRPCSERSYYRHLNNAKRCIFTLSDEIKS